MANRWSNSEINKYAGLFSEKVISELSKEYANGEDLLNLSPVRQINLFVISNLYSNWKEEFSKLRSSYFDYQNEEVQAALKEFMNVLSRNIKISIVHLSPLLQNAFSETIYLNQETLSYFMDFMREAPDFKITKDWLVDKSKFFERHGWILRKVEDRMNGIQEVFANESIEWLNDMIKNDNPEDYRNLQNQIIQYLGIKENSTSFFESFELPGLAAPTPKQIQQQPVVPVYSEPPVYLETSRQRQRPDEVVHNHVLTHTVARDQSLNDYHGAQDRFASNANPMMRIDSIRGGLSLNQRFLFLESLFRGDAVAFNDALTYLDTREDFTSARAYISNELITRYKWDLKAPETEDFFELVRRKFH